MRDGDEAGAGSMRGCGLWLVMLAGAAWVQVGAAQTGAQTTEAMTNASVLPHTMTDESFVEAVDQVRAAAVDSGTVLGPLHLRYELKMEDYKGKPHSGTYETWSTPDANRIEIHTDAYNGVEVSKDGQRWVQEEGLRPLRVMEFMEQQVLPNAAMARLLIGTAKLKATKLNKVTLMCAYNGEEAKACFDPATGFVVFGTVDGETVDYGAWRKLGWRYLAGVIRITRLDKMLVEANMTLASGTVSPEVFAIPTGAVESNLTPQNMAKTDVYKALPQYGIIKVPVSPGLGVGIDPSGKHHLVKLGSANSDDHPHCSGKAQVMVSVDENGHVTKAELEDADDKQMADLALDHARGSVYVPEQENGGNVGFITGFYVSIQVVGK
jgi:hypothetical protein